MTSPAPGVRGPYAKTARVRRRILDAGAEVFAASGYRGTTMKEVAERAEMSEGGLARHFSSKTELLGAVLERRESEASGRHHNLVGLEALLTMIDVVSEDSDKPGIVELHSIISAEATSADHPAHPHYRERYEAVRQYTEQAFVALRDAGELDTPMTVQDLAAAYIALSDGLQLQWLYDPETIQVDRTLRRFLAAVMPRLRD